MITGLRRGIDPPLNSLFAYSPSLTFPRPVITDLASAHRINTWVADRVIRPMVADLIATGRWRRDTAQRYVLQDRLCHCFFFNYRLTHATFYLADHGQHECLTPPGTPPLPGDRTWFCSSEAPAPPPENSSTAWRHLLRTASLMPVNVKHSAFAQFTRTAPPADPCPPDAFLATFESLARRARTVHTLLPDQPGIFHVVADQQLWTVARPDNPALKPRVLAIQYVDQPTAAPGNHLVPFSAPDAEGLIQPRLLRSRDSVRPADVP